MDNVTGSVISSSEIGHRNCLGMVISSGPPLSPELCSFAARRAARRLRHEEIMVSWIQKINKLGKGICVFQELKLLIIYYVMLWEETYTTEGS